MSREHVRVSDQGDGIVRVGLPFKHLDLDHEEAGEVAQRLLQVLGCSFEISWPKLKPTAEERPVLVQQALRRRREAAEEYASELAKLLDVDRETVVQAWIAGHDASPKPINHPYR